MTNPIDFLHGSSFANALHSISNAHLAGLNAESNKIALEYINQLIEMVDNRNLTIERQNATITDLNARADSGLGFIRLLEEEIEKLRVGVVTENRLSGNNQVRINVRDELESLAQKVDPDLACRGGRFSGNRVQNLRDVLHMRIDEFFVYGKENGLIHPDTKKVYSEELRKETYAKIETQKNSVAEASRKIVEVLLLQRSMNKNYLLAADASGNKPKDYPYKAVNLIAAVGFTVKQLCDHANVEGAPFIGNQYCDPPAENYGRDSANDGAAALLQLEYRVLEDEADQRIRQSGLADGEALIAKANARHAAIKTRLAAKMAIVRFAEVQADLNTPAG